VDPPRRDPRGDPRPARPPPLTGLVDGVGNVFGAGRNLPTMRTAPARSVGGRFVQSDERPANYRRLMDIRGGPIDTWTCGLRLGGGGEAVGLPSGDEVETDKGEDAECGDRRERIDQHERRRGEPDDTECHTRLT
jgi:hypothetical protein